MGKPAKRKAVSLAAALLLTGATASAQTAGDPPMSPQATYLRSIGVTYPGSNTDARLSDDSPMFNITELAPGVYNAIGVDGVFANSQVIVNSDHVVVVDAQLRPSWAKEMIRQIRKITPKPVRYVVYTHWHIDHAGGAQAYLEAFPGVQIVGHAMALHDQVLVGFDRKVEFLSKGSARSLAAVKKAIADGVDRDGRPLDAKGKAELQRLLAQEERFLAENDQIRNVTPTVVYDRKLVLRDPAHDIELINPGVAHTRGDTFVYLPKERMLFTGDAFGWSPPGGHDGYPVEWQASLEQLYHLDWDLIVPAHGRPFKGREQMAKAIAYMNDMNTGVRNAVAKGMTLDQTKAAVTLPQHAASFGDAAAFPAANARVVARAWAIATKQPRSEAGEPVLRPDE